MADTWINHGQQNVGKEIERHNRCREHEDDSASQLLIVGPRQRLQQGARLGQRQNQRGDQQLVKYAVQVEAKPVDDRTQRMASG